MSLRSCGLRSRSIAATVHLDKLFHRTIFSIPRPDRGRASKAFKGRGRPERRAGDAARSLRDRRGDTRDRLARWPCGGFASPARRPKPRGPGAPQRVTGLAHRGVRSAMRGRRGQLLQRWIDAGRPRGTNRRHPKRQPPGVARSKPSNTARGTPGNRHFRDEDCLCTQTYLSCTGSRGARRPGVPRALGLLVRRRGELDDGVPRADQTIGAAQRWLSHATKSASRARLNRLCHGRPRRRASASRSLDFDARQSIAHQVARSAPQRPLRIIGLDPRGAFRTPGEFPQGTTFALNKAT